MPDFKFNVRTSQIQLMVISAAFAAIAVALSGLSFPVGPVRCFPIQHAVNVVTGILLGPFWAVMSALVASLARNAMGMGTLFAFPGSLFGALFVGLSARYLSDKRVLFSALAEPLATTILGAGTAALIVAPFLGKNVGYPFFALSFFASSALGALLGAVSVKLLLKKLRGQMNKTDVVAALRHK